MWRALFFLFAAFTVAAFPAASEYGECEDDDLYDSLRQDGEAFCNELLDPECYTSITTPVEYATYDDWTLSSYCSCVYEPCHHDTTTSSDIGTLPSYTRSTYTTTTTEAVTTSETQVTSTTAVPGKTTSSRVANTTWSTSSGPRITTVTILPGNKTSTQWFNTTTPTPSETETSSTTSLSGNITSTQWFNTTTSTPSETEISSTTSLSGNITSTQWLNTTITMPTPSETETISTTSLSGNITSTQWLNTTITMPAPSETGVTSTTIVSENTTTQASFSTTPSSSPLPVTTLPGSITSTQVSNTTSPTATPTPFDAANFTSVLRGPAPSSQACHHRPAARDGTAHLATLQNEEIRQRNLSLAFPYVGSINFDSDDMTPLYLSVRDAAKGAHLIDVSDSTAVTIFDSRNNSMRLDLSGIHFVTGHCNLTVSYLIDNLYGQLAQQSLEMCSMGRKKLLAGEQTFVQTLVLRDQCGNPVGPSVRRYPDLRVDGEQCIALGAAADSANGTWRFDCPWQSAGSAVQRCMSSLQRNAVEFLLYDPFNGGCADASSVITMLEASARDMLNITAIRQELHSQVGNHTDRFYKVDDTVMYYMQLWETLKSTLSKTRGLNPGRGSNLKQYLDTYNRFRNFAADACTSLNSSIVPAVLSLSAGSSTIPRLASLASIPVASDALTATIQDPAKVACCPNGGVSVTNPDSGKCAYPAEARVPGTGCVCGKTATQQSVAFKYRQCDNFVSQCQADSDCADAGYAGFLCLIGSCCGKGVCFDPFECSRPEVLLLPGSAD